MSNPHESVWLIGLSGSVVSHASINLNLNHKKATIQVAFLYA
ncbi:hypothetical protein [Acinetobacter soli]|nr:hypothetical protein [Acinetobacter soli]WOQ35892.1 hypothetical protein R3L12_09990 [Acinetobacter soli]